MGSPEEPPISKPPVSESSAPIKSGTELGSIPAAPPQQVHADTKPSYSPLLESTPFWGALGIAVTLIATYVGFATNDIRWFLVATWPFLCLMFWEMAKRLSQVRIKKLIWGIVGAALGAVILWGVGKALPPPKGTDVAAQLSAFGEQLRHLNTSIPASQKLDDSSKHKPHNLPPDQRIALIQQARTLADRIDVISNKYWAHLKEIETKNTENKKKYDPDTYRQHFEPFYHDEILMNDTKAVAEYEEDYRDQAVALQHTIRQMAPEAREPEMFQGGEATRLYERPNLGILPEISQDLRSLADALQAQMQSGGSLTPH
jgi:hypothetical protein